MTQSKIRPSTYQPVNFDMKMLEYMTQAEQEQALAYFEALTKIEAKDHLRVFAGRNGYTPAKHHQLIIDHLEALERREIQNLLVITPPGAGKSVYSSILFPAWYIGRNPKHMALAASNTMELAERFGRKVRGLVSAEDFGEIFEGTKLSEESAAAARWETNRGAEYFAVGCEGSIVGRRGDALFLDDVVRSKADVESEQQRDKVWNWYVADVVTRLKPNAVKLFVNCVTGDAQVLMADGSETPLRDIRPGDSIATYDEGVLSTAKVLNWVNQGLDDVFEIKTISGRCVKANARHPFLVCREGVTEWVRLKELKTKDRMMCVTEHGKTSSAPQTDVNGQQYAKDFAVHTTTRTAGLEGFDPLRLGMSQTEPGISGTGMASKSMATTRCLNSRTESVPSAGGHQLAKTPDQEQGSTCALTTATIQEQSGGCFVTTATSQSGASERQNFLKQQQDTSDFYLDEIVSITPAGREEVFDIQVERTENFIANGCTASNTRWHEDDLAGRILDREADKWTVLHMEMENTREDDPLGRAIGERLWPEWFTQEMVDEAKQDVGTWNALYQGRPSPDGGGEFKKDWVEYYDSPPDRKRVTTLMLVDPANSKTKKSDYTAIWVLGVGGDDNFYVLDMVRDRLDLAERIELVFRLHRKWKPVEVRYERFGLQTEIDYLKIEMDKRSYRFRIREVAGNRISKEDRIRRLIPYFKAGRIVFPREFMYTDHGGKPRDLVQYFIEDEMAPFPVGKKDDLIDSLSRLAEPGLVLPKHVTEEEKKEMFMLAETEFVAHDPVMGY